MEVISFRVPKNLKEEMKKIKVDWSEEMRKFIERKIRSYRKEQSIKKIDLIIKSLPKTKKGTAEKYMREDRDSN
ncbi:MAG: hypothetical protein J7K12_01155 [Thermoplasmata archaeon]|nr:hypothetical protein [Thermoplasmata archaeon]